MISVEVLRWAFMLSVSFLFVIFCSSIFLPEKVLEKRIYRILILVFVFVLSSIALFSAASLDGIEDIELRDREEMCSSINMSYEPGGFDEEPSCVPKKEIIQPWKEVSG